MKLTEPTAPEAALEEELPATPVWSLPAPEAGTDPQRLLAAAMQVAAERRRQAEHSAGMAEQAQRALQARNVHD